MKLYLNKTSPYARLVLVTAAEAGLAQQIEKIWVEPWDDVPELLAVNPLAKVPALLTADGVALIESAVICDYLLSLTASEALLPAEPQARTATLHRLGLGRATIDCAFGAVIRRRYQDSADSVLSRRWLAALPRAAASLEPLCAARLAMPQPDLGDLAVAVAFAYLDFRLPDIDWRKQAPQLAVLVDRLGQRASMRAD